MQNVKIIEERYIENHAEVSERVCVDAAQILAIVESLNGSDRTSVLFLSDNGAAFSAGGGEMGRYVAFFSNETDETLLTLINPEKSGNDCIDLVAGGQKGSYPCRQCIDKSTLIKGVLYFCEFSEPDLSLHWEEN